MASGQIPRATTTSSRQPSHRIGSVKYPSSNRVAINLNGTKYDISKMLAPYPCRDGKFVYCFTVRKVADSLGLMVVEDNDMEW